MKMEFKMQLKWLFLQKESTKTWKMRVEKYQKCILNAKVCGSQIKLFAKYVWYWNCILKLTRKFAQKSYEVWLFVSKFCIKEDILTGMFGVTMYAQCRDQVQQDLVAHRPNWMERIAKNKK